jgi:aryl-alcohol dehydrogenase-like predicted oxidoreductase
MIPGRATAEGTERFRRRFEDRVAEGHFRRMGGLWLSSVGMGTYLGAADEATDEAYVESALEALRRGCNVFDAAINYRHQRSERALGEAIERAVGRGMVKRDELFVSTKGGFLPLDGELPTDPPGWLKQTYVDSGLVEPDDLAAGCHAISPAFLADQIGRSRDNLRLETVDLYYLHNPETQYGEHPRERVADRLGDALVWLDGARRHGWIGAAGLATWNGLRVPPHSPEHLGLTEVAAIARATDSDAELDAVQLPLNVAMPEALVAPSQTLDDALVPALVAARRLGLAVLTSASILQGRLATDLPERIAELFPGLATDAQRALQFARSAPGVTTALVGMSSPDHVAENLALAAHSPAPPEAYQELFSGRPAGQGAAASR